MKPWSVTYRRFPLELYVVTDLQRSGTYDGQDLRRNERAYRFRWANGYVDQGIVLTGDLGEPPRVWARRAHSVVSDTLALTVADKTLDQLAGTTHVFHLVTQVDSWGMSYYHYAERYSPMAEDSGP